MDHERYNFGHEFDGPLIASIRQLLVELGFKQTNHWEGMGGSQEISHWEYINSDGRLILEAETYIGVTLEGPDHLVEKMREAFETSQRSNPLSEKR